MNKKTLLFDCFGVVADRVLGGWVPRNLPHFKSEEFFNKIDIGDITEEEALNEFARLAKRSPEVVRKEIDAYFKPNNSLIEYIKELKTKGHKIILLTNSNHSFFERFVFVEHPWFRDLFDNIIISSQIKMIKPNSDIFFYALKQNNLNPEDAIFIDDSSANIVGAQNVGINAILFKDTKQLKNDIKNFI